MLKYLIILLDDTSVSYCHYENIKKKRHLISLKNLKAGILYGMKENLMIQFVYPDYDLPEEYKHIIDTIDHSKIVPFSNVEKADVLVFHGWDDLVNAMLKKEIMYVLRTDKQKLFENYHLLQSNLHNIVRLNIVITDMSSFTIGDFDKYKQILSELSGTIKNIYREGSYPQINILTDRIMLDKMNNCNAGWENITLAPNGRFYVCPAFYLDENGYAIGDINEGLNIKNPQLYKLAYAPICRQCDAYQCKRCIWLNRKTTFEINTPSSEQCIISHLERNASRELLLDIRKLGILELNREIKEIDYLDPFDVINKK